VGVAVAGRGVPLVVVHGFGAEGVLYAQTLSRLVGLGFMVIAVDAPGHGGTDALGARARIEEYVADLEQVLSVLGIRRAVLVGHSMGGRIVAELATAQESLAFGVILVDPIMGDVWDRMNSALRVAPLGLGALGAALVVDTVSTLPVLSDPRQALKLARLVLPTGVGHVRRPWRLVGPLASILLASPSGPALEALRRQEIPVAVVHGDRDLLVPLCSGMSAAARAGGELVVVHGARHSWMLRDPETFPAIVAELLDGRLGDALRDALGDALAPAPTRPGGAAGRSAADGGRAADGDLACCTPGALVLELVAAGAPQPERGPHEGARAPRFRWTHSTPAAGPGARAGAETACLLPPGWP
jgi:pimeloyl-ACP methyl ester carboxylesterase